MTKPSLCAIAMSLALGCTATNADPSPSQKANAQAKSIRDAKAANTAKAKAEAKANAPQAEATAAKTPPARPAPPRGKQVPAPDNVAAPPADAKKTESGIAYVVIKEGSGEVPGSSDTAKVRLSAWQADGVTIETTDGRKSPKMVPLGRAPLAGVAEAIGLMKPGENARFWIPQELTYKGRKGAPEGTLCYDITLEEVLRAPEVPDDVAAPPADTQKTESGLAYRVLTKGTGDEKPDAWDRVKVHYSGWTTDGKMFDSSITRGREATFPVGRVVPGWTEGLQLMVVGETTRFWIPEELAYKGQPGKPPGMLVFDIELLEIDNQPEPPPPPEVPADVAAPPADAKKTASGLAYKVLTPGKGADHPAATDSVSVHYSGWTTDGKMFDSSVTRGKPSSFPLNRVIKGWTEGLQLMVVGEKTRFWIPVELAYQNRPGKPAGMLVFDVELLEITGKK